MDAETHAAPLAAAVEQLGLVVGETRASDGDMVLVEALNIQHGRLPAVMREMLVTVSRRSPIGPQLTP